MKPSVYSAHLDNMTYERMNATGKDEEEARRTKENKLKVQKSKERPRRELKRELSIVDCHFSLAFQVTFNGDSRDPRLHVRVPIEDL
ncbi:hypothetical protein L596_000355 [Steinernema carpocapsae]|uniref:Uncharacterized protein n=1 Tax=Steinernema carpocapsae TaxID=34508 RepID=A0A4U8UK47_STECR|nr:hypothetical protein L596_000355 [Steinernema carpocapsae]